MSIYYTNNDVHAPPPLPVAPVAPLMPSPSIPACGSVSETICSCSLQFQFLFRKMSKHSDVNTEASKIIRTSDHDILLYLISIKRSLQSLVARFGLVPGTLDGRFPQGFINAAKKRAIAAKYLGRPVTKETDSDATKIYDEVTEMRKGVGALPGCLNGDIDNLENPALKHHSAFSDVMHARGKIASMLSDEARAYLDAVAKKGHQKTQDK